MRAQLTALTRRIRDRPLTAAVAIAGIVVSAWISALTIASAVTTGISNDEPTHVSRLNVWLAAGIYIPPTYMDLESETLDPEFSRPRAFSYGPAFSITAHVMAVILGQDPLGKSGVTAGDYALRHIMVALLGIAAAVAVGLAVAATTRSRTAGVWGAAAALALPLWAGYSSFAVKDVPAAAGWTFFTTGLILALHPSRTRWRPILSGALVVVGIWFAVGVRAALWLPLAGVLLMAAVLAVLNPRRSELRRGAIAVAVGLALGTLLIVVLYARYPPTLQEFFLGTITTSGDFPWSGTTLTAGQLLPAHPPWWYLPAWVGGSLPLLVGALALVGLSAALWRLFRRTGSGPDRHLGVRGPDGAWVLWGLQACALPAAAIVLGSTAYAGLRQHLYVLPALAAFAALAAHLLITAVPVTSSRVLRGGVAAGIIGALVAPAAAQTQLFPYAFTYKNVLAGPINDRWESDLHWVSAREALQRIPAEVTFGCYTQATVGLSGPRTPAMAWDCSRGQVKPFLAEQGIRPASADAAGRTWFLARKYRGSPPAVGCEEVDSVTRRLYGEDIVMSYVLLCASPGVSPAS